LLRNSPPVIEPKVYYLVHKIPPLDPILSQMNPVLRLISYFFRYVSVLSYPLHAGLSSFFSLLMQNAFLISSMRSTCPVLLICLDFHPKQYFIKGKAVPLHAMEAHGVRGGEAPTHS
jgi:hypothetical protein